MGAEARPSGPTRPIVSIVIPAHNEEASIGSNLGHLLAGTTTDEFDVVVVANACHDRTADIARTHGVRVIETAQPGKTNALHIGDAVCRTFPRVYLDADVRLSAESVRALVAAAAAPGVLACAPVPRLDLGHAGAVVKRVHRVHDGLVGPNRALAGVGVYMLNEAGHARVFPMPDGIISDDGWVHASFAPHERAVVAAAESLVRPAGTVRAHLHRRVRVRRGNRQLADLGHAAPEGRLGLQSLVALVGRREVGPLDAGCYVAVHVVDRTLTRLTRHRGVRWGSDASSRDPALAEVVPEVVATPTAEAIAAPTAD